MSKKMIAILVMLLSFAMIFFSFVIVSMNGFINGQTKFYETFFVFNANYIDEKFIINIYTGVFFVGFFVFLMPNLLLSKKKKIKLVLNSFVNILGFIMVYFLYSQQNYIFMMVVVCTCIAINIIFLSTNVVKKQSNILIIVFTLIFTFLNILMLFKHLIISMQWKLCGLNDIILNQIIDISTKNAIYFALFYIPCILLLFQEIKINKKYRRI